MKRASIGRRLVATALVVTASTAWRRHRRPGQRRHQPGPSRL